MGVGTPYSVSLVETNSDYNVQPSINLQLQFLISLNNAGVRGATLTSPPPAPSS